MSHDLEILQELFLPLLGDDPERNEAFWADLNNKLVGDGAQEQELPAGWDTIYITQWEQLRAEYLYYMAQAYCAGQTNPTIDRLVQKADTRFIAEASFQRDMLAAITQVSRAELRAELEQAAIFAGDVVTDVEISAAFNTLERNIARNDLRHQLQQWDEEAGQEQQDVPAKRKRRLTVPLLLLRFAAAAAVFTGGFVGVMHLYNNSSRDAAPTAAMNTGGNRDYETKTAQAMDTAAKTDSNRQGIVTGLPKPLQRNKPVNTDTTSNNSEDSAKQSIPAATVQAPAQLSHISVRGAITETETGDTVYNVMVTLTDDKGNKQTHFSKDGTFRFGLALHHNYMIIGAREHYHSVPRSLSTKNIKDTDADTVMTVTLQLAGDR